MEPGPDTGFAIGMALFPLGAAGSVGVLVGAAVLWATGAFATWGLGAAAPWTDVGGRLIISPAVKKLLAPNFDAGRAGAGAAPTEASSHWLIEAVRSIRIRIRPKYKVT
jgi:hypothetical protein